MKKTLKKIAKLVISDTTTIAARKAGKILIRLIMRR